MSSYNQQAFIDNEVILRWLDFEAIIVAKDLFIQYADGIEQYQIFAFDGVIGYLTNLYKPEYSGTVQYDPDYSQAQNDLDYIDFTTNYLANANQVISTNSRASTGSITTNGELVYISSRGSGNIGVNISGTWVGTLQFQATVDDINYTNVFAYLIDNGNAGASSTSGNGAWRILGGGLSGVRVIATAFTSGTANVTFEATGAASSVRVIQGSPLSNLANAWPVKMTDGTSVLGTISNPIITSPSSTINQPIEITDGYNGIVAVKPASTAAISTDRALVVAISPNNPITVTEARASTTTNFNIVSSVSNAILLPPNSIRLGATIFNDSRALLYIKLGASASLTDFNIKLLPQSYYEIPYGYTGEIDGFWSYPNGYARIGELT